jgi:hypothetical protein
MAAMPSYVILCDRDGQTYDAELTLRGWYCPRDGGELGDVTGVRQPRVGTRCRECGAVVVETLP